MSNKTNQSVLVNDTSSYYLKQYAALQFPGSVDNFGTKTLDANDAGTAMQLGENLSCALRDGGYQVTNAVEVDE